MNIRRLIAIGLGAILLGGVALAISILVISARLPSLISIADYKPLMVSEVYAQNGEKVGEFFRERRIVTAYDKIPQKLVRAFIAAEDSSFFEHGGINFVAILRAFLANLRAGHSVQGASTITQQVAKSILLNTEKTYIRKLREALFAYKMEAHLSKEEILYLYLNQIYLGQGAYGVAMASQTYFRKNLDQLSLAEMAILAGLPKAPSSYSPIHNPIRAKERQRYVLGRMVEENFITKEDAKKAADEPVSVYMREDYKDKAPYYLEAVRQYLVQALGESTVLDQGIKIYTPMDVDKQVAAQKYVQTGLRSLDKRQGFRGATKNLTDPEEVAKFLLSTRDKLIDDYTPLRTIAADGRALPEKEPLNLNRKPDQKNLPEYIPVGTIVDGVVTKVDDAAGLVTVRFAETQGLIDLDTMAWARKPNPNVIWDREKVKKPSEALKSGDVIEVKVVGPTFISDRLKNLESPRNKKKAAAPANLPDFKQYANVELEQEPNVEGALLSFDLETSSILAMVGGYNYAKSEFNRALQALRQTGSSFKPVVYTAALDDGFTPASVIVDSPIVYEEEGQLDDKQQIKETKDDSDDAIKKWKPSNYSEKFAGDILFRNALIKSLNIPTVKILEKVGVERSATYARRLGIISPLNMDLSLGLGSSSVTLYEMTKVFSAFGRQGKRIRPIFISKVTDREGKNLLENVSLDMRFEEEIKKVDADIEEKRLAYLALKPDERAKDKKTPPIYFDDPDQLLSPQTAYLITSLLKGVVDEGTGARAKALGRTAAGKTGTTNGYYDAWFMGYTPSIATGVWVGSDVEKTLGRGETGAAAALPIWLDYMKVATQNQPDKSFPVPSGIVSVNIDNETGNLGSASSKELRLQPFLEGTEPKGSNDSGESVDKENFYKEDLTE